MWHFYLLILKKKEKIDRSRRSVSDKEYRCERRQKILRGIETISVQSAGELRSGRKLQQRLIHTVV